MRITFLDADSDSLTSYRKGELFESFTRRLVHMAGYEDIRLRVKRSSLEYDIEARSKLHGRTLIGEAKAHEASMNGKEVAAFVGKLLPLAMASEGIDALFISTSPFTPEAEDYLRSLSGPVLSSARINLRTLVGDEIPRFLAINGSSIREDHFRRIAREVTGMEVCDTWLIVGSSGDVLGASFGRNLLSSASHYAVFSLQGKRLELSEVDQQRVSLQVPDLEELVYFDSQPESSPHDEPNNPVTLPPVVAGAGWFDYKFPSPPECFVGRSERLSEVGSFIGTVKDRSTSVRAIQVLSRSGVGKSSLLLKIAASRQSDIAVTVDGRNLRSPSDLRLTVTDLVNKANASFGGEIMVPQSQEQIVSAMRSVGQTLTANDRVALLQIDQFEAILSRPVVFQSVLDLLIASTSLGLPICWIMARKNDLAVTYDEGASIDLSQLNETSRPIHLDDFGPHEEQLLLARLGDELGGSVSKDLAEAILTFSAGFPWLLKRVCAHVISMSNSGVSQSILSRGGLRAEDLFNEDLAGLEESDKALLRTFAAHMPTTAGELARRIEGEVAIPRLTQKLNEFLGRKLLRLSGDVYDTYNDVFKAYLLTRRVPFQTRFVLRVTPGPALDLLMRIFNEGSTDAESFFKRVGGNRTATQNKLRDLRQLGLLDPQSSRVAASPEVATAIENDTLGDYLRRALRSNSLVAVVLDKLANLGSMSLTEIGSTLAEELPHIGASNQTWSHYAMIMANWVRYAGMADMEGDRVLPRDSASDEQLLRRDFNLGNFIPGTFIPSVRPRIVSVLTEMLQAGPMDRDAVRAIMGSKTVAVIRDAVSIKAVEDDGEVVRLSPQGRALLAKTGGITDREVAVLALSRPNVVALLDEASKAPLSRSDQRKVLNRFGNANWADRTWDWRIGILTTWLVASGQAKAGKAGLRPV